MADRKRFGQYFTPSEVAETLVRWALRSDSDRLLDPSCGDGEFLAAHQHAVGIELDQEHAASARERAPGALVHQADFFDWAQETHERFEGVVGNPPFIRYQGFSGEVRQRALRLARRFGATISELTSSWAPFVAASCNLLKPGGRIAFVVPAEIGHATYAAPLLEALCARFERVHIVAIKEKLFPELAEDAWLLFASGFGSATKCIKLSTQRRFTPTETPPKSIRRVAVRDLTRARWRLRRWLLPADVLRTYEAFEDLRFSQRLGDIADVNIGYVSGGNDFFHLRPSLAKKLGIPTKFLKASVRRGASLQAKSVLTSRHVQQWIDRDEPVLLLHITPDQRKLPSSINAYLTSSDALSVREAYKCRVREPWYSVPDVRIPDGFLTYMSGSRVQVVRNDAACVATNSVHVVHMKASNTFTSMQQRFGTLLTRLSCELEGHPLGGGMLKLEPREAQRVLIPKRAAFHDLNEASSTLELGIEEMQHWRHYG
jgi:adenine-specific DNA-methyltransferase